MENFELSPNQQSSEEKFSLTDENKASLPDDVVEKRSFKFNYALGSILKKTHDELFQDIYNGNEENIRTGAASELTYRKQLEAQKAIAAYAAAKQNGVTPEEAKTIETLVLDMKKEVDPTSVMEDAYGKQILSTLDQVGNTKNTILSDIKQSNPEGFAKVQQQGSSLVTKREFANTLKEDIDAEIENQSWAGWGVDLAKQFIPGYTDVKLRGNVPDVSFFESIGLGNDLEEQRKALLNLPVEEFTKTLKKITDTLREDNPQMARDYVDAVIGMSTDDVYLKNIITPLDIASVPIGTAVGSVVRGIKKGIKAERTAEDVTKAVQDVVKASAAPDVSKSVLLDAAGDATESAVTKATTNAVADIKGVPQATKRAVENLMTVFRTDIQDIKNNPGRFGQEIVSRIEEDTRYFTEVLEKNVLTAQRVERLPEVMATEASIRAIQEDIMKKYPSFRNVVVDVTPPYKEPVSNTWLVDVKLGKTGGTYFTKREQAENFIKWQGLQDAVIEEGKSVTNTVEFKRRDKIQKLIPEIEQSIINRHNEASDTSLLDKKREWAREQIDLLGDRLILLRDELRDLNNKISGVTTSVEQQGLGYYVKVTKPINESDSIIRQLIGSTSSTKIPDKFLNAWIGKIRTPEEVLSQADRQNRLVATYTPSIFINQMQDAAKEIKKLRRSTLIKDKQKWEDFNRVVSSGQDIIDPDTNLPGYFFKSPGELEDYYQRFIGRLPDQQEIAAYFEFKRGMEADRFFRNISEVRNQSRLGAETHSFSVLDNNGEKISSPKFSGVLRREFPGGEGNILVMGKKLGEEKIYNLGHINKTLLEEFKDSVLKGTSKVVEVWNPSLRPFEGMSEVIGDNRIRYVMTKELETSQLDWNQIPRRGGGHVEYEAPYYVKQANVKYDKAADQWWYEGDNLVAPVANRAMGKDFAKKLDAVRVLLKNKDLEGAKKLADTLLPEDSSEVLSWFRKTTKDGKVIPARLSLDHEIQVIERDRRIIDTDKNALEYKYGESKFRDGTRQGSLAAHNRVQFSGERDSYLLQQIKAAEENGNIVYNLQPADKIDPISSMNRSLNRIVNSVYMDDYKTFTVEHWLRNASRYLDIKESEINYSPFWHYAEPKWKSGAPKEEIERLMAAKYHADSLIGIPSKFDTFIHSTSQKLADSIYEKYGSKSIPIVTGIQAAKLRDPTAFIRSMVFNAKMGLFNIPQFIVQSANYANVLGIAGYKNTTPGFFAAQLAFWGRVNRNPEIAAALDDWATKLSLPGANKWKPGEFTEALDEMNRVGFGNVGKEFAALDDPTSIKVIDNSGSQFLDWGQVFFREGERNAKYGAWFTAFKEFRDKNPIGRITDVDRAEILQRADLLNINMSRASSSMIHKGVWSIPAQFYTYQLRLLEMFTGKRLTGEEKLRLFATNAALYGVPMGAGLTGLPVGDSIRRYAMENGYVVGDNFLSSIFMEGIPSILGAMATGGGDYQSGNFYNFGERFGTKGFDFINSALRSDKTIWDIFGGATYSTLKNTFEQSDGFRAAVGSLWRRDEEKFPMTVEDVVDVFREISTINTLYRTIAAFNTGKWLSKKDAYIADTSKANAVFAALTGLQEQKITDIYKMQWSLQEQKDYEKAIQKQFLQEFRRAVIAQETNPEQAQKFFTRAQAFLVIGGYPEHKITDLISIAVSDNKSLIDKINWDFYINNVPDKLKDTRTKAFERILELKDNK